MSKAQQEKGKRWERQVVKLLKKAMPGEDIRRGWQSRGGHESPDVDCPVFWVECKSGKKPNPRAALKQAICDCSPGRIPVAVIKDDRQDPFVVMTMEGWLELVQNWWSLGHE
jgi:hypothetical protein